MKLLVVIVNYRTPELTIDCLQSLAAEIPSVPGTRVVVADNASDNGSIEKIRSSIAANNWHWATLLALPTNGGFAYGNNQAIEPALKSSDPPDYFYLLNPDTLVLPGALKELVDFLEAHPQVGIAGGRAINRDGTVRNSMFRFHTPLSELEGSIRLGLVSRLLRRHVVASPPPDQPAQADWVSGASMMIRREVFDRVGLLDHRYFMYYEETDFCLRARRRGWQCWYVPSSRIIHLVGQSSGVTGAQRVAKRRPRYWFESRHRYFVRHYGIVNTVLADMLWTAGYTVNSLFQKIRRRPRTDPPWLLWDFIRYNLRDYVKLSWDQQR